MVVNQYLTSHLIAMSMSVRSFLQPLFLPLVSKASFIISDLHQAMVRKPTFRFFNIPPLFYPCIAPYICDGITDGAGFFCDSSLFERVKIHKNQCNINEPL